jgi:hypothetical protein
VGAFLRAVVVSLTFADNRVWRTLRLLVFSPGRLTTEYLAGRRARYMAPVSVFFFANLIYFVVAPMSDFNPHLADQYQWQPYSAWVQPWVDAKLAERGETLNEYAPVFDSRSETWARLLIILQVPLLALGLRLGGRVWQHRLFHDHVIHGLHLFAFLMLVPFGLFPWLFGILTTFLPTVLAGWAKAAGLLGLFVISLVYFGGSLVRFGGWNKKWAVPATLICLVPFALTGLCYRFVLLVVTLVTT